MLDKPSIGYIHVEWNSSLQNNNFYFEAEEESFQEINNWRLSDVAKKKLPNENSLLSSILSNESVFS